MPKKKGISAKAVDLTLKRTEGGCVKYNAKALSIQAKARAVYQLSNTIVHNTTQHDSKLSDLDVKIDDLEGTLDELDSKIDHVDRKLDKILNKIDATTERITSMDLSFQALNLTVARTSRKTTLRNEDSLSYLSRPINLPLPKNRASTILMSDNILCDDCCDLIGFVTSADEVKKNDGLVNRRRGKKRISNGLLKTKASGYTSDEPQEATAHSGLDRA